MFVAYPSKKLLYLHECLSDSRVKTRESYFSKSSASLSSTKNQANKKPIVSSCPEKSWVYSHSQKVSLLQSQLPHYCSVRPKIDKTTVESMTTRGMQRYYLLPSTHPPSLCNATTERTARARCNQIYPCYRQGCGLKTVIILQWQPIESGCAFSQPLAKPLGSVFEEVAGRQWPSMSLGLGQLLKLRFHCCDCRCEYHIPPPQAALSPIVLVLMDGSCR